MLGGLVERLKLYIYIKKRKKKDTEQLTHYESMLLYMLYLTRLMTRIIFQPTNSTLIIVSLFSQLS